MKKLVSALLILGLLLGTFAALADAPAPGSLSTEQIKVRGNTALSHESYPEVWITPYYAAYIVEGNENYPPKFMHFPAPENASPYSFRADEASFIDFDTLLQYSYVAYDRAAFELFLEEAAEDLIIADGSDGVAMYTDAERRRAYAMIDIGEHYEKSSKLRINLYDSTGDMKDAELAEHIQAEVERVMGSIVHEELTGFWSEGVFTTVDLNQSRKEIKVTVDVSGLIPYQVDEDTVEAYLLADGEYKEVSFEISTYSYAFSNEDENEEVTLSDGSVLTVYRGDYTGYAAYTLLADGDYDSVYLAIEGDSDPDTFLTLLEELFALVTLPEQPE